MATCSNCGGWKDDGYYLCPACKRNQDLIDEQESIAADQQNQAEEHEAEMRRIAEEQTAEQERIANESHLNEIKRKLMEIAVEGVSEPRTAAKKALVLMGSPDFESNVDWFWPSVSTNSFLKDTYLTHLLSTVNESTDAACFFDAMDAWVTPAGSVFSEAVEWLNDDRKALKNRPIISEKLNEYSEVLRQREQEQTEREEEEKKQEASNQATENLKNLKRKAARGTLGLIASAIFMFSSLPIAWSIIAFWFSAWKHGGNSKEWSVILASAGSSSIGSSVAVWTAISLYGIGMLVGIRRSFKGTDETNEDNKNAHILLALVGSIVLTVLLWGRVTDTRQHVAMVAACVILPFIPLIRLCLASIGGGMLMAYLLVVPAWVVGWTAGSITGWFSNSHPVKTAPANPGNRVSGPQDSTLGIINRIQSGH